MRMSDTPSDVNPPDDPLQFDRVEYTAPRPAATCRACGQAMADVYYEVNGQAFCPACREHLQKALASGSSLARFARATMYGSLAGLVGAAIYYGVRELTGFEFGLISIVVGLMVGKAVNKGSEGRGGWFYQGLAVFVTYTAIVLTYIPPVIQAVRDHARKDAAAAKPDQPVQPGGAAEALGGAGAQARPSFGGFLLAVAQLLLALAAIVVFAYAIPIVIGFQSPMGLIIVGIGLYEAWVMNRRAPLVVRGPYKIGSAEAGSAVHVEPAG